MTVIGRKSRRSLQSVIIIIGRRCFILIFVLGHFIITFRVMVLFLKRRFLSVMRLDVFITIVRVIIPGSMVMKLLIMTLVRLIMLILMNRWTRIIRVTVLRVKVVLILLIVPVFLVLIPLIMFLLVLMPRLIKRSKILLILINRLIVNGTFKLGRFVFSIVISLLIVILGMMKLDLIMIIMFILNNVVFMTPLLFLRFRGSGRFFFIRLRVRLTILINLRSWVVRLSVFTLLVISGTFFPVGYCRNGLLLRGRLILVMMLKFIVLLFGPRRRLQRSP